MHYLMTVHPKGGEEVGRYLDSEMEEMFTTADRAALSAGETLHRWDMQWIDMRAAARAAMRAA